MAIIQSTTLRKGLVESEQEAKLTEYSLHISISKIQSSKKCHLTRFICHRGTSRRATPFWQRISKLPIWGSSKYSLMHVTLRMMKRWWAWWRLQGQRYLTLRQIYIRLKIVVPCNNTQIKQWIWQIMFQEWGPLTAHLPHSQSIFSPLKEVRLESRHSRRWLGRTTSKTRI